MPDERLIRIAVTLLVVRNVIQQHQPLTVSHAPRFERAAIVARGRGGLQRENQVLVQDVEMPCGAIRHRAAVQRLRHENKIPFARAGLVDDVFPALRRNALAEIRAQTVDAFVSLVRGRALRAAGLVEPVEHAVGEVAPDILRHRIEVTVAAARAVLAADGRVEPIAFVGIISRRTGIGNQRGVAAKINIRHVAPFAEVKSVGRLRHVAAAGRALVILAAARIEACLAAVDRVRRLRVRLEIINPARVQLRVPRRVVERLVQHDADARAVRRRHEVGELLQRRRARVRLAQERVDLEKVFHRIRTADRVRLVAIVRIGLAVLHADGMDRLEPQPVDAEVLRVSQIETVRHRVVAARTGAVVKIRERAAIVLPLTLRADGHRVQFIH